MIQRIQTLFLALGAIALLVLPLFDAVWQGQAASQYPWYAPTLMILAGLTVAMAVAAIFLYKNRDVQRKVVIAAQVLTVGLLVVLFSGLYLSQTLPMVSGAATDPWGVVMLVLPVVAYVLFFLARRNIDKDIKLIKSMDRLR